MAAPAEGGSRQAGVLLLLLLVCTMCASSLLWEARVSTCFCAEQQISSFLIWVLLGDTRALSALQCHSSNI